MLVKPLLHLPDFIKRYDHTCLTLPETNPSFLWADRRPIAGQRYGQSELVHVANTNTNFDYLVEFQEETGVGLVEVQQLVGEDDIDGSYNLLPT